MGLLVEIGYGLGRAGDSHGLRRADSKMYNRVTCNLSPSKSSLSSDGWESRS